MLVRMIRAAPAGPLRCPPWRPNDLPRSHLPEVVSIKAILDDVNTKGGPARASRRFPADRSRPVSWRG